MPRWTYLILCLLVISASCKERAKTPGPKSTAAHEARIDSNNTSVNDTIYYPDPVGYVNDFEQIFTPDQEHVLDSIIRGFEKKTTNEIAIVTIDSSWTTDANFEYYTFQLANRWGVGKKEKNNGVLIGLSKALRHLRIEVGKGLEKALTDEEAKEIIDLLMIPSFKEGNYYKGVYEGLLRIMDEIK